MATNPIIASLPETERKTLELCGITRDEQLAHVSPQALLKDMGAAAAFFPGASTSVPTLERLEALCKQALRAIEPEPAPVQAEPRPERDMMYATLRPGQMPKASKPSPTIAARRSSATGRMLMVDENARNTVELDDRRKKDDPRGFSHSICNSHPLAVYLGAWATIFFVAALVMVVLGALGLLIGVEFDRSKQVVYAVLLATPIVFYFITMRSATCSTCRINIYSFRPYPRHKGAPRLPLLGYTLTTALSTIFLLRFRCPSCGTPQKLLGHRHARKSRRH